MCGVKDISDFQTNFTFKSNEQIESFGNAKRRYHHNLINSKRSDVKSLGQGLIFSGGGGLNL